MKLCVLFDFFSFQTSCVLCRVRCGDHVFLPCGHVCCSRCGNLHIANHGRKIRRLEKFQVKCPTCQEKIENFPHKFQLNLEKYFWVVFVFIVFIWCFFFVLAFPISFYCFWFFSFLGWMNMNWFVFLRFVFFYFFLSILCLFFQLFAFISDFDLFSFFWKWFVPIGNKWEKRFVFCFVCEILKFVFWRISCILLIFFSLVFLISDSKTCWRHRRWFWIQWGSLDFFWFWEKWVKSVILDLEAIGEIFFIFSFVSIFLSYLIYFFFLFQVKNVVFQFLRMNHSLPLDLKSNHFRIVVGWIFHELVSDMCVVWILVLWTCLTLFNCVFICFIFFLIFFEKKFILGRSVNFFEFVIFLVSVFQFLNSIFLKCFWTWLFVKWIWLTELIDY